MGVIISIDRRGKHLNKYIVLILISMLFFGVFQPIGFAEEDGYAISVETNRPSYEPGFIVNISGRLTLNGEPASDEYIGIEISAPGSDIIIGSQPLTDEQGYYYTLIEIEDTAFNETYYVYAAKGYAEKNITFEVVEEAPNLAPYSPRNPTPADESEGIMSSVTLHWTGGDPDPEDIVTYSVFFGKTTNPDLVNENQTETSYGIIDLDYETNYYWQIISYDSANHSTVGPLWMFTTKASGNNIPAIPENLDGTTRGYHGTTYVYTVSTIDYDADDVYYQFNWSDGNLSTWFGPFQSEHLISMNHSWSIPGNYTVTVRSKDEYDAISNWSEPVEIVMQNRPPSSPTYPIPPNGSTNRAVDTVLRWETDDPDTGDVLLYDIYLGTSNPPEKIITKQSNNFFYPTLEQDTLYYWKIVAWDQFNGTQAGPLWHFHTQSSSAGTGGGGDSGENTDVNQSANTTIQNQSLPPTAAFTFSPSFAMPRQQIIFDASPSSDDGYIAHWNWDFGDGTTATGEIVSHSYSTTGIYQVQLTVIDDHQNQSNLQKTVVVFPLMLLSLDISAPQNVTIGNPLFLQVSIKNQGPAQLMDLSLCYGLYQDSTCLWNKTTDIQFTEDYSTNITVDTDSFDPGNYEIKVWLSEKNVELTTDTVFISLVKDESVLPAIPHLIMIVGGVMVVLVAFAVFMFKRK